jgi:hypothetical protein
MGQWDANKFGVHSPNGDQEARFNGISLKQVNDGATRAIQTTGEEEPREQIH